MPDDDVTVLSDDDADRYRAVYRCILGVLRGQRPRVAGDSMEQLERLAGDITGLAAGQMVAHGMERGLTDEEATAEAIAMMEGMLDQVELAMLGDGVMPPPPPLPEG